MLAQVLSASSTPAVHGQSQTGSRWALRTRWTVRWAMEKGLAAEPLRHGADRARDFLDVPVGHRLIEAQDDAVGEDRLGDRAGDGAVVHRRQAGVANGPRPTEKIMILKNRIPV